MNMNIWVIGTLNKLLINSNQILKKVVSRQILKKVVYTPYSICLNIRYWHSSFAFSIDVRSTKNDASVFQQKLSFLEDLFQS